MRLIAVMTVALFVAGAIFSAEGAREIEESVERGTELYRVYCASCHGLSGTGDGPTEAHLAVEPADLTRIAERNGGVFPGERMREVIDGRVMLRGHGTREMPIWGLAFSEWDLDVNQEPQVRQRIDDLVSYLRSIQPTR